MKKSFIAAVVYLVLGLGAGVFYREFTKANEFEAGGYTQLSVLHTHFLSLGFLFFLIVIALDKLFDLSDDSRFNPFFWAYNAGLVVTTALMTVRGVLQVQGVTDELPAISGIAGLGHILLSLGLALLAINLGGKIWASSKN